MKVLYIVNGLGFSQNMPIGGADKRVAEIGKCLMSRGVEVSVLTTAEGQRLLKNEGLPANFLLTLPPADWPAGYRTLGGRLLSYIYLTFVSFKRVPAHLAFDVIYPSSDFFFDLIPALVLKAKFKKARLVGIVHHRLDWPWRRPGRFLTNLFLFLIQLADFFFFRYFDVVLVPHNLEGQRIEAFLRRYYRRGGGVDYFENGVDFERLQALAEVEKEYEAGFLGGFRPSKGMADLVPIWQEVVKRRPRARLLLMGGGTQDHEDLVRSWVKSAGLSQSITLAGVLPPAELFRRLKSCWLFVYPSYEEGWGIAVLEALACGLPAVVYDLPAYRVFGESLLRVPLGDRLSMAESLSHLLTDEKLYEKQKSLARQTAQRFSWTRVSQTEYAVLEKIFYVGRT